VDGPGKRRDEEGEVREVGTGERQRGEYMGKRRMVRD